MNKLFLFLSCAVVLTVTECNANAADASLEGNSNKMFYLKNNSIWVHDPVKKTNQPFKSKPSISNFNFSNDGSTLVYVSNKNMYITSGIGAGSLLTTVEADNSAPVVDLNNNKVFYVDKSPKLFNISKYQQKKVRHIWMIDISSKVKKDITEDSSFENASVSLSPDGKHLSFASTRDKDWHVYVMQIANREIKKVGKGIKSVWLDKATLAVGSFNKIKIYDTEKFCVVKEIKLRVMFNPSAFSFTTDGNIYYEESSDGPDIDISYLDIKNGKVTKIVHQGRYPQYLK